MSCESKTNKVSRAMQRVGLHRLAAKKMFYVGLAAGAASLVGGLTLARLSRAGTVYYRCRQAAATYRLRLRQLYRRLAPSRSGTPLVNLREVPEMSARQVITPTPRDEVAGKCADCGSSPQSKPGAWYVIDGQPYCQDCAPRGARETGKGLQSPASPLASTLDVPSAPGGRSPLITPPPGSASIPVKVNTPAPKVAPLDPEGRRRTTLQRRTVAIKSLVRETGQVSETHVDGYEVLAETTSASPRKWGSAEPGRPGSYAATGMTIAPAEGGWTITHLATGHKMAGPYESPTEAQQLASVLAQLDWTARDPVSRFSDEQKAQVAATIRFYDEALKEARTRLAREARTGDEPAGEEDGDEESLEQEALYSYVEQVAYKHGFRKGFDAGADDALQELGIYEEPDSVVDASVEFGEEEELDELALRVADDEVDFYEQLYQQARDEGYAEGHEEGYSSVMERFAKGEIKKG